MAEIKDLLSGFERFRHHFFETDARLYNAMQQSQPAKTMMIACSDSRVDPAILTDCDPGDLFIVRNVANLVPPPEPDGHYHGTSAAIEFAVEHLGVDNIIVMGHANCGGIKALWMQADIVASHTQYIAPWVSISESARLAVQALGEMSEAQQLKCCEQASVKVSLENLMRFDVVRERVETGDLSLYGWYFDIQAGALLTLSPHTGEFAQPAG